MSDVRTIGHGNENGGQRRQPATEVVHPAWADFMRYCQQLQFGELEKVKIQNGIPMLAEVTIRKVKFGP